MNEAPMPARAHFRNTLLASALALATLYALDAAGVIAGRTDTRVGVLFVLLLLLPVRGAWTCDGRAGFWYALLSTLIVAHGLAIAASADTRVFGLTVLGAALAMFVIACAFARRHGLQSRQRAK